MKPVFLGGQNPQPKQQISFSDKIVSHWGGRILPQEILFNFLVKIFFLVGLGLFLTFFLLVWNSSPSPCFMPFAFLLLLLSTLCFTFFLLWLFFSPSDCIPLPYNFLRASLAVFSLIKVQFQLFFPFKHSYFAGFFPFLSLNPAMQVCWNITPHLWFHRISLCSYIQTHQNLKHLHKQLFYSYTRKAELTTSVSVKLNRLLGEVAKE